MSKPVDQKEEAVSEVVDKSVMDEVVKGEAENTDVETPDGAAATDGEQKSESAEALLEAALKDVAKYKDAALRAEAEMQNLRRRSSIDLENAHKFGIEKLIQNLLPVVDSLEKGIESAEQAAEDAGNKAIIEGVSLCHKMLVDALGKEGVVAVDPQGEPFDPNLHQALSMIENPDVEPNSVVVVVQKGYTLKSRLVRPAMVMVSKPAPKIDETA